jgi:uncharacterized protein with PQ loop repeat
MFWAVPALAAMTVGLFFWFLYAFMSDNNHDWTTSEPVQIVNGVGTVGAAAATVIVAVVGVVRASRRRMR